jgi:4-diphosphocytidyl-2-C-methyl-D-erythritol kinase
MQTMDRITLDCPAKINLLLGICGKRADGFHSLVSVVSKIELGDTLTVGFDSKGSADHFEVKGSSIEALEGNTVEKAVQVYREKMNISHGSLHVSLKKHIPIGAGLGGGSSDAVGMLLACKHFWEKGTTDDLIEMAALIGSDCPLFLYESGVVIRGRGEQIEELPTRLRKEMKGRRIILFKPSFSIETRLAYKKLAEGQYYSHEEKLERQLKIWRSKGKGLPPRHNDFESLVEYWYPSLAVVLNKIRLDLGYDVRLSGSGSSAFVFTEGRSNAFNDIFAILKFAWGESFFCEETTIQ